MTLLPIGFSQSLWFPRNCLNLVAGLTEVSFDMSAPAPPPNPMHHPHGAPPRPPMANGQPEGPPPGAAPLPGGGPPPQGPMGSPQGPPGPRAPPNSANIQRVSRKLLFFNEWLISCASFVQMLDENASLIRTITELQSVGKHAETLQYQCSLHRNLMYLASIADSNQNLQTMLPVRNLHVK